MPSAAEPEQLRIGQYKDATKLDARVALHARFSINAQGWLPWLFEQLELPDRCSVLELGCGPAGLWVENANRIPAGWQIRLSDFSAGMLAEAEQRLRAIQRSFSFEQIDATSIPLPGAPVRAYSSAMIALLSTSGSCPAPPYSLGISK